MKCIENDAIPLRIFIYTNQPCHTGTPRWTTKEETMIRSLIARVCIGATVGLAAASAAVAQDFPTKPIRLIVPFGPGGVADVTARIVSQGLADKLGKSVIVENAPGAGGIAAAQNVLRSPADGYTLFLVSNQQAVSPSLFRSLPYDPVKQFQMVSLIGSFDIVMLADEKSPLKTVGDAVAAAKKSPESFNIGTIAVGSTQNLAGELFRTLTGLTVPIVPFKSTGEVLSAIKGNNIQAMFELVPGVIGNIKSGSLKVLGTGTAKRSTMFPDTPTIAESGVNGYVATSWNGIAAPQGTPAAVVAKLNQSIREVVADPATNKKLAELGLTPQTNTPAEFEQYLVAEIAKWRKVIDDAKIEKLM